MKRKVRSFWVYNSFNYAVVFRGEECVRHYDLTQLQATRLAFKFSRMQIRGTAIVGPHGHGYFVEPRETER